MVQTRAAALEMTGDGSVGAGRLQQFDAAVPDRNEGHLDTLFGDLLLGFHFEAQGFVEPTPLGDRLDRDPDVVEERLLRHHTPSMALRSSRAITIRWISEVPSPIVQSLASRHARSTG